MAATQTVKFDKAVDDAVKAGTQQLFDTDGKPIVGEGLFKRRVKAQLTAAARRLAEARHARRASS